MPHWRGGKLPSEGAPDGEHQGISVEYEQNSRAVFQPTRNSSTKRLVEFCHLEQTKIAASRVFRGCAVLFVAWLAITISSSLLIAERNQERRRLDMRSAELTARVMPASSLACLDGGAGELVG